MTECNCGHPDFEDMSGHAALCPAHLAHLQKLDDEAKAEVSKKKGRK